ncbi:MAG: hypothetical protein OQK75_02650 [Gammaproteobacteria bacterium]|nr:hypothetical protein [Gammaproteobacteria bacterium]MCW8986547.1 hypothetical protein [Gammaproteobacteria bacterium]MCW9030750.1 hypothetical protein [Gammaproteobacteria bacterium]
MRGYVPPDPYTKVSEEQFAVVYVPKRSRNRFPKGCVEIVNSKEEALKKSAPDQKQFPARVLGPSKSSEGQYIYYLVEWLDV